MTSLVGYINYVKTGTLAANNAAALFPVTNLQNDSGAPADGWQTTTAGVAIVLTITPPQARQDFRLIGLFRTNITSSALVAFSVWANPSTLVWTRTVAGPVNGSQQVFVDTGGGIIGDYATVTISNAANPSGYINVPLAYAGPAWAPLSALSLATSFGRDVTLVELTSYGGQEYPLYRYQRRRWDLDMQGVRSASELWQSLDALMRAAASGGNIFVVPDTTNGLMNNEATFGRLKQTADIKYPYGTSDRRSWAGQLTERI